jgi:hypothetical protein
VVNLGARKGRGLHDGDQRKGWRSGCEQESKKKASAWLACRTYDQCDKQPARPCIHMRFHA